MFIFGFECGVFYPVVEGGAVDTGFFCGGGDRAFGQEVAEEFYLLEGEGCLAVITRVRARGFVAFCGILSYFVEFCRWREEGRRAGSVVVRRVGGGGGWGLMIVD